MSSLLSDRYQRSARGRLQGRNEWSQTRSGSSRAGVAHLPRQKPAQLSLLADGSTKACSQIHPQPTTCQVGKSAGVVPVGTSSWLNDVAPQARGCIVPLSMPACGGEPGGLVTTGWRRRQWKSARPASSGLPDPAGDRTFCLPHWRPQREFPAGRNFCKKIAKQFPTRRNLRENSVDNTPGLCSRLGG